MRYSLKLRVTLLLLLSISCGQSFAQAWPSKPITMIVAYPAGGGADPIARQLAEALGTRLNQRVVVENRPGAAGMIGAAAVAKAQPDGHTVLFAVSAEVAINQHLYKSMSYDPQRDLAPVSLVVKLPLVLVAHPALGLDSAAKFFVAARQKPNVFTIANAGNGTLQHVAAELLTRRNGLAVTHVPYKGVAPAVTDILGNQVNMGFVGLPTVINHIKAGKLNAIGMSTSARSSAAPDIPSLSESPALRGFDVTQWFGVFVPAKTPTSVITKLNAEINAALAQPEVRAKLIAQGAEPSATTPEQFRAFVSSESQKFKSVISEARITLE